MRGTASALPQGPFQTCSSSLGPNLRLSYHSTASTSDKDIKSNMKTLLQVLPTQTLWG